MVFLLFLRKKKQFHNLWFLLLVLPALLFQAGLLWASVPDAYESDDSFEEAQVVVENPVFPTQQHSFHQFFDEDWYTFYCVQGPQGPNYRIYATPDTGKSDPVIELYSTDGLSLLVQANEAGPGEGELLGFNCLEDGYYYVRLTNNSPYFGIDVSYTFFMDTWFSILNLPNGYIQGKVTSDGIGLGGVSLAVGGGVGLSQSDGTYIIGHQAGSIELSVRKDGYYPKVYSATVEGNQITHLDIELEKIPTPSRPPVISGTPPNVTTVDQLYSFVPTATDPDGDSLVFSLSNKPSWASFNPDNGMFVGVPTKEDVGSYGPIVITVSDSQGQSASLTPFFLQVQRKMSPGILMLLNKEMEP